jgi:hypothetical protein
MYPVVSDASSYFLRMMQRLPAGGAPSPTPLSTSIQWLFIDPQPALTPCFIKSLHVQTPILPT